MDLIDRLLEHDKWATSCLLDVSRGLSDDQLDQSFDIGHRTLRATYVHMIPNVAFWTALMEGRPVESQLENHHYSIAELIDIHERSYADFAALARRLRDERRLDDTFVDHYQARKSMIGTILQVVFHNTEHRTEALHILDRLGVPNLPEVDHGLWDYQMLNP